MKVKTSELAGRALDWAVAQAEKLKVYDGWLSRWDDSYADIDWFLDHDGRIKKQCFDGTASRAGTWCNSAVYTPSTDWAQGGPIIEREKIEVRPGLYGAALWACWGQTQYGGRNSTQGKTGPTPLVAAMRCFVASRLGEKVEVPEETV